MSLLFFLGTLYLLTGAVRIAYDFFHSEDTAETPTYIRHPNTGVALALLFFWPVFMFSMMMISRRRKGFLLHLFRRYLVGISAGAIVLVSVTSGYTNLSYGGFVKVVTIVVLLGVYAGTIWWGYGRTRNW